MLQVTCKQCSRQFLVLPEAGGRQERCPQCGNLVHVPGSPTTESRILEEGDSTQSDTMAPKCTATESTGPAQPEDSPAWNFTLDRPGSRRIRAELWTFLGILSFFCLLGILASGRPSASEIFAAAAEGAPIPSGFSFTYEKLKSGAASGILGGAVLGALGAGLVYVIRKDRTADRHPNRQRCLAWSMALLITGLHVGAFFLPTIEQRPQVYVDAGGAHRELPDPLYRGENVELKEPKIYYGRLEPNFANTSSVCFLFPLWLGVLLLVLQSWRGALITGIIAGIMVLVHHGGVAVTVHYVPFKLLYGYYVWYTSVLLLPIAALIGLLSRRYMDATGKE